ncbi:Lactaldehyde dehydrogenase [Methyloversatilis universalis FAM5]|uniref:Lactaldehyde dehydrogenase n=1 Tax=Methyloversatilis universalis (strain ATCC BAA-1314 / DSM 25237 / JCM 13912 / CCUG 52030 / FAM5) TaxID=1000565 RepID=F5RDM2_METUF|nr:aldehyde dehydrogenase [Methyloversatilis universalis]EGK71003.1 Lactaldehyde dehydrogenase [Methyloversatilis universalis FAM5]
MTTHHNYIDGRFDESDVASRIEVFNPATHALLDTVPEAGVAAVERAIAAARTAQPQWAKLPAIQRAGWLRKVAEGLRGVREEMARLLTLEQGKTLGLARVEVDFTADYLDYMAEWARRIEGEVLTSDRPGESIFLLRKPVGVVAGILPWNFPLFLIARKMAPALVTGNTIVIKPSEETPLNAFLFAKLVHAAELPRGVFNLIGGRGETTGAALTGSSSIDMVSFTGSVATGSRIMQAAGRNLTRVNLELGGKAPAIVLADADLDLASTAITASRVINTGQVCNCAERVYVQRSVADEFITKLTAKMAATRYGDPIADQSVDMGPLVNKEGLDKVAAMVEQARRDGAQCVLGGRVADRASGYHYEPTVLINCHADMDIMRSEIFGPVLPVQLVDDLDEAVAHANASDYGLTSSVYTRDLNAAMRAIRDLQFGETYVNRENFEAMQGFHAGRRKSGIGGADGKHGLYEYTETQVAYIQHG